MSSRPQLLENGLLSRSQDHDNGSTRLMPVQSSIKAPSTLATMSKQHSTLLPFLATMSNEISSFRQSRNKLNMSRDSPHSVSVIEAVPSCLLTVSVVYSLVCGSAGYRVQRLTSCRDAVGQLSEMIRWLQSVVKLTLRDDSHAENYTLSATTVCRYNWNCPGYSSCGRHEH